MRLMPFFIFLGLLIGDPDQVCELLLGETEHDPPCAHARADMPVNILNAVVWRILARFCQHGGHGALHPLGLFWHKQRV